MRGPCDSRLESHAVCASWFGAIARKEVGFREGNGEKGTDCQSEDSEANVLRSPCIVCRQKSTE